MSNIEKHRDFLDSLEGEKGLPEEMHGLLLDMPLDEAMAQQFSDDDKVDMQCTIGYLIERCRRAESRQIPDLKEKVKELMRDAMDAEKEDFEKILWADDIESEAIKKTRDAFRALCAPNKGGEVKP